MTAVERIGTVMEDTALGALMGPCSSGGALDPACRIVDEESGPF